MPIYCGVRCSGRVVPVHCGVRCSGRVVPIYCGVRCSGRVVPIYCGVRCSGRVVPTYQVEKVLRGQRRFAVLETRNDGVRFTTSQLRSLSQQFQSLRESYESTQASLAVEVLAIAAGYAEPLATLSSLLARMDVLVRSVSVGVWCLCITLTSLSYLQFCSCVSQCTHTVCEASYYWHG